MICRMEKVRGNAEQYVILQLNLGASMLVLSLNLRASHAVTKKVGTP